MPTVQTVRTTAFRLTEEHFGIVHVYRPGPRFTRAWDRLEAHWRDRSSVEHRYQLPYGGLSVALRVLNGDFVGLQRSVERERAFVLSRRPISRERLEMAIGAWEVHALGLRDGPISDVLDDLSVEQVEVAKLVQRRLGLCPTVSGGSWPWGVAIWEVAHRLAAQLLHTDTGPIRLRLDSDAALLTWDRLVGVDVDRGVAMHKITPSLITIPGVQAPVVSLQASLVRLAPTWREAGGARYARAEIDPQMPILRARVRHFPNGDGSWRTEWDDRAAEVLRGASLQPLPNVDSEPVPNGVLRTGYAKQPRYARIGRGVGTWFHECVAHHARKTLGPSAQPVALAAMRATWPTRERVAPRAQLANSESQTEPALRVVIVYASPTVRRRLRDALVHVLRDRAPKSDAKALQRFARRIRNLDDNEVLRLGPLEVQFIHPPRAAEWLLRRANRKDTVAWLDNWLPKAGLRDALAAALVETDESAANGRDDLDDPKHVLRGAFAARNVVTQFVTQGSAPEEKKRSDQDDSKFDDHAAANAVSDLMRSAGLFLRPFPAFGAARDTLVVGVYGARVTARKSGKGKATYLVNLVAVRTGARIAWGYIEGRGWRPLGEATARFLGSDHDHDVGSAKKVVEQAVEQLRLVFPGQHIMILFDALGCRRFWACLTDKSEGRPEPWMLAGGKAVVRVRTASDEVLRPAGAGLWTEALTPARHTAFRPMAIDQPDGNAPYFVVSGSAVMSQGMNARKSTRLATTDKGLREDWHALGSTEILVLDSGSWTTTQVVDQVAMMCRIAPTWERALRWPSPLHLARAVVRDHPHRYFADLDAEAEEIEDNNQLRFDNITK